MEKHLHVRRQKCQTMTDMNTCVFSDEWEACIEVAYTIVVGHGEKDGKQNQYTGVKRSPGVPQIMQTC